MCGIFEIAFLRQKALAGNSIPYSNITSTTDGSTPARLQLLRTNTWF
jgi:hypothetical protein